MVRAEGTYLAWLDFRGTGLECKEINRRILEQAKIAVDPGEWFGEEGRGFARFNLACRMDMVKEAMGRLRDVFQI